MKGKRPSFWNIDSADCSARTCASPLTGLSLKIAPGDLVDNFCLAFGSLLTLLRRISPPLLLISLSILFLGCAQLPSKHITHVDEIQNFQVKGKLGIRSANKAQAINFSWKHKPESFDIKLNGPLGFGAVNIRKKNDLVELQTNRGIQTSNNAEGLLAANTGVRLPIEALESWILGKTHPELPVDQQKLNESNQLTQLSQQGWNIQFKKYQQVGNVSLPEKIVATQGSIRLTIAITSWQI